MADVSTFLADLKPFFDDHLQRYLADGLDGHFIDGRPFGGPEHTTTLILKTFGRVSGKPYLTPLIYDRVGEAYVIVASRGGDDRHPDWFLNLTARDAVDFQVARDRFRGRWRVAEGEERQALWDHMAAYYPPYGGYQALTSREIPIVLLAAHERLETL